MELIGGDFNPVDSNELAYRIATGMAISTGLKGATPVLMEPIMLLTVISPDEFVGDILNDINPTGKIEVMRRIMEYRQEIVQMFPLSYFSICYSDSFVKSRKSYYTLEFKKFDTVLYSSKYCLEEDSRVCE